MSRTLHSDTNIYILCSGISTHSTKHSELGLYIFIPSNDPRSLHRTYTCQLFLRCRREIFILGVLGFLKTTRSCPKISEEVRSLPKTSKVFRRRSYQENAYPQGPTLVAKNPRSRGRYCHLFILHLVFVPYMGLS